MTIPALKVEQLDASYGRNLIVHGIDFEVNPGRIVGVIGPNGAGKSTLLKALLGLVDHNGKVHISGKVGYVPQREEIDWDFPVSVWDVVMMGRYGEIPLWGKTSAEDKRVVQESLKQVGMWDFRSRQIGCLSGGQQQRVFLARALAQEADVYFMDEPFAGVDAKTESAIMDILQSMKSAGRTLLIIHHDLSTAKDYFDNVLLLNRQVVAYGEAQSVFTEENLMRAYEGKLKIFHIG